jgi:hypothetical protein
LGSAVAKGMLKVGERVVMEFFVEGRLPALVRHKLDQHYGFEFTAISADQVRRITEHCRKFGVYRHAARKKQAEVGRG